MPDTFSVFWFRRDLRLYDNAGLFHALESGKAVIPIFIFDKEILDKLPPDDQRVVFIYQAIKKLKTQLESVGSTLLVQYGKPAKVWASLTDQYPISAVFTNHDYEPYATERDHTIKTQLDSKGIKFHTFKDQVIFEKKEILTGSDKPYTVFTPFSRKWKAAFTTNHIRPYPSANRMQQFFMSAPEIMPTLEAMGFERSGISFPENEADRSIITTYDQTRNFPALNGTTRMGIHLRFGTVSIRALVKTALELNETYLNELIWREFYMQILWNFPYVVSGAFKKQYDAIPWRNNEDEFKRWCEGTTGYPIVDAGIRELNETGYMHNRVRMITASFLTKHLLIDWRWGEAWFAEKLLDYELASNNGGWQWAASCGCDAAPYFRVFNPELQMKKFDKDLRYVRKWVPEFGTPAYPRPVVDHAFARKRAIETFREALNS